MGRKGERKGEKGTERRRGEERKTQLKVLEGIRTYIYILICNWNQQNLSHFRGSLVPESGPLINDNKGIHEVDSSSEVTHILSWS